jgi:hypothetical protein
VAPTGQFQVAGGEVYPPAMDELSERYGQLLAGAYDCVDRIVLNAYFPLGHNPGGFRCWWRRLHHGGDEHLDNTHLMRMAGRFSRRVRGLPRLTGSRSSTVGGASASTASLRSIWRPTRSGQGCS